MAISKIPFRSISLPSRLHPINSSTGFETNLEKLKSWHISSLSKTVPNTSDTIQSALLSLAELHNSVVELTQSSATQQSVVKDEKSIEDSLENSVELLDSCNTMRELAHMMRENVQALQSALRRKNLVSNIQNDISSYFCLRKKMNKCISKSLKELKNLENKNQSNVSDESFIRVLREVNILTIATFKSTLVFFSSPTVKSGGWNLVSRLMITKSVDHNVINEVGCVDFALSNLRNIESKVLDTKMVQRSLQNLDSCVEGVEAGLETLFRQLLQTRVKLLNIFTDH